MVYLVAAPPFCGSVYVYLVVRLPTPAGRFCYFLPSGGGALPRPRCQHLPYFPLLPLSFPLTVPLLLVGASFGVLLFS